MHLFLMLRLWVKEGWFHSFLYPMMIDILFFIIIQLTFIYLAIMFGTHVINYRYANLFEWCCECV